MVSANNNKSKEPLEDDPQDPKLEEEVKSEAEEEVEGIPRAQPRTTVESIGVVANPLKLRRTARMSTGGKVPRHTLASRTPSSGINNPYHTLIHTKRCMSQNYPLVGIEIVLTMHGKEALSVKKFGEIIPRVGIHRLTCS